MPNISFHPGYNGVVLLILAGTAVILVALFYRRAYRALGRLSWTCLYLLRIAAIGVVLLLLFRPVLSFQREILERRAVVFLLDCSSSMGIADDADGGTRLEHAVDRMLVWLDKLSGGFETHLVAFSDSTSLVGSIDQLRALRADGGATSLSRALEAASRVRSAGDVEAVFLLSDGVHNSAGDPLVESEQLGIPVHTVGTGNALRGRSTYRDVRITGVEAAEQMSVDNRARIQGYVDAEGYPGRVVRAELDEDGRPVAEGELVLDDVDGPQEVTFEFTPSAKGLHIYTVRVPPANDEKIAENNARSLSSLVIDARIRVLYVEGTLRAEYGALVGRFLSKDPNVEFCALVQTRPNVFMQRSNIEGLDLRTIPDDPEVLERFDVFLIGDLDSSYLRPAQMELIRDRVRSGAGLLMTGGYHSLGPGGYEGTPLAEGLPVFVGDREIGQIGEPFHPRLTPTGRQHPILANITQFFPSVQGEAEMGGLPPLLGSVRVLGPRPSATVLAIHPSEMSGASPMPVLAVQPWGAGRTAVFTADTTRNWHQAMRTLDRETPFLRFWGQTVRWLAGRSEEVETEAGIVATSDKAYYEPESSVAVTAVVRGAEGEAETNAQVSALIRRPEDRTEEVSLAPLAGPAGNYRVEFEPQESGRYEIAVRAVMEGSTIQAEPLQIDVGRPNLEFDRLGLDEKMLVAIAGESGGTYAHITTADRLVDRLLRRQERRRVEYELPLHWPPLLWIAFVTLLTTEWILRRRWMLR